MKQTLRALAIAGNAAIFSILEAVLLEPLPYRDPRELVTIDVKSTRGFYVSTAIPYYRDWRDRSRVFASYSGSAGWELTLTGRGAAELLNVRAVLGDFFGTLGLEPLHGRVWSAAEAEPGAEPLVVVSHGFWQRRLGGDPGVIGQTLLLDERPFTIVGVLAAGAGYPGPLVDIYVPMGSMPGLPWDDRDSSFGTRIVAPLMPQVSTVTAQQDLDRVTRELEEQEGRQLAHPEIKSLTDLYVGDMRKQIWILAGARWRCARRLAQDGPA